MSDNIKTTDIISYAMLAAPLAFAGMPLYVHAPDYYATQYGTSLTTLGLVLLFIRLFDAIQDPLIGTLSDRYTSKRLHIIIIAAIFLVIGFIALFQPPAFINPVIWFAITMAVATTAFSILGINLNTIGGMWSRDRNSKTRISSYREAFGLTGLLTAVILPAVLIQTMPPASAFMVVGLTLGIIMLIALILFTPWFSRHSDAKSENILLEKDTAINIKPSGLYITYFTSMLASAIPAILVLFFIRDRLQSENLTGLFLALYFLSGALGMPLWQYIARKKGKHFAWITGMALAVLSFFWAVFITPETAWQFAIICIISGIALGSDLALPPAILADKIHNAGQETSAASQYGLLTFLSKAALAAASAITLPLLEFSGYKPGASNTPEALSALAMAYAGIPCLIKCVAIALAWQKLETEKSNVHITKRNTPRSPHNNRSFSND